MKPKHTHGIPEVLPALKEQGWKRYFSPHNDGGCVIAGPIKRVNYDRIVELLPKLEDQTKRYYASKWHSSTLLWDNLFCIDQYGWGFKVYNSESEKEFPLVEGNILILLLIERGGPGPLDWELYSCSPEEFEEKWIIGDDYKQEEE
jgi:hypothetical protein